MVIPIEYLLIAVLVLWSAALIFDPYYFFSKTGKTIQADLIGYKLVKKEEALKFFEKRHNIYPIFQYQDSGELKTVILKNLYILIPERKNISLKINHDEYIPPLPRLYNLYAFITWGLFFAFIILELTISFEVAIDSLAPDIFLYGFTIYLVTFALLLISRTFLKYRQFRSFRSQDNPTKPKHELSQEELKNIEDSQMVSYEIANKYLHNEYKRTRVWLLPVLLIILGFIAYFLIYEKLIHLHYL